MSAEIVTVAGAPLLTGGIPGGLLYAAAITTAGCVGFFCGYGAVEEVGNFLSSSNSNLYDYSIYEDPNIEFNNIGGYEIPIAIAPAESTSGIGEE